MEMALTSLNSKLRRTRNSCARATPWFGAVATSPTPSSSRAPAPRAWVGSTPAYRSLGRRDIESAGTDSSEPLGLSLQFDVPVKIVAPAVVEMVRWERAAVLLKLPTRRADRFAHDVHVCFRRRPTPLAQIARGAGRRDILPGRATTLGARNHMVEGQFARRPAIDAAEFVAEDQIEPRERRIFVRPHILAKCA